MEVPTKPQLEGAQSSDVTLLLTTEEAARALRVSRSRLYEWMGRGEVPGVVRFGRSVRISRRALETWVDAQANEPAARAGDDHAVA